MAQIRPSGGLSAHACAWACLYPLLAASPTFAADAAAPADSSVDADNTVQSLVVSERKSSLPDNVAATVESYSRQQIDESVNAMTAGETLKYLPSVAVRERYIGDRNGILSTRTTGTVASAQALVYADDLLLSNLLGNSYAYPPRWGMVSPAEIEQVDMIYGPFSAAYPGNAFGGVAVLTTRMPDHAEAHAEVKTFAQSYKQYSTSEVYTGYDANAQAGTRIGRLAFWVAADHLDSHGQPMQFATASQSSTTAAASVPVVTGVNVDSGTTGAKRLVFGATSIDHTVQDMGKLKLAYDVADDTRLTYTLGLWQNQSHISVDSYVTDASGATIYTGDVSVDGKKYTLSMNPSQTEETHLMNGLSLKRDSGGRFDYDLSVSDYHMVDAQTRTAAKYGVDNTGTIQHMDGTGWDNIDLRGTWRPQTRLAGRHELSAGYHGDRYVLDQVTYSTDNWHTGGDGAFSASSDGKTQTQALYLQDAWTIHPDWTLTLGGRQEFWSAFDGANGKTGVASANYDDRDAANFSPKASLAYQATPSLTERLSVARAYRYPTVSELFQSVTTGSSLLINTPNLKPEEVTSYEWASEYQTGRHGLRLSLFHEDRRQAIISQTDQSVTGSSSTTIYENVDHVRSSGVEVAARGTGIVLDQLDLMGSVTFVDSRIVEDRQYPAAEGRHTPSVPTWRAKLAATYHHSEDLTTAVGLRYASRAYATLNNADNDANTYGGTSEMMLADVRVSYKLGNGMTAALGVDNAFGYKAYVYHPYPQTTVFAQLKFDY